VPATPVHGNDKLAVRLGGIYTMERIAREHVENYWSVMETLTAFVRENARWQEPNENASESLFRLDESPAPSRYNDISTDIAAVLSVICQSEKVEREKHMRWSFDLQGADLRRQTK
jgi:hypothetical protein